MTDKLDNNAQFEPIGLILKKIKKGFAPGELVVFMAGRTTPEFKSLIHPQIPTEKPSDAND